MPRRKTKLVLDIAIASSNDAKIREIKEIFSDLPVRLLTRADVDAWPEPSAMAETGLTYLENALIKARAVARVTGVGALADDSGIEIDALDGGPGIRSARFAGVDASDEENNAFMASLLEEVPPERRTARYRCVAVLALTSGLEIADWGTCEGSIAIEPRGDGGFGYDPWFIPVGGSRTMGELSAQEKHAISHRGKAFRALAEKARTAIQQAASSSAD